MPINAIAQNFPGATLDKNVPGMEAGDKKKSANVSDEDTRKVQQLSQRDREVRAHEAAHVAAGGQYVKGGATFQYQKGPDGKMYAVGGEVSIDTSPVKGDPQATIIKMEAIKRAAMAPADPSGQDRAVAGAAASAEAQARQEASQKTTGGSKKENAAIGLSNIKEPLKTSSYNKKGEIAVLKDVQASLLNLVA
jgi:hypothetical protein